MDSTYHRWTREEIPDISIHPVDGAKGLVIAFTGYRGQLSVGAFDFFDLAHKSGHSRIMLKDPTFNCYLEGIPAFAEGVEGLAAYLREQVSRLAPARTMVIGSSGGSHPALLFGHLIGADWVHAFSPFTNLEPDHLQNAPWPFPWTGAFAARVRELGPAVLPYCDLKKALAIWNGRTTYNLHACSGDPPTVAHALHLEGLPQVRMFSYPCDTHVVLRRILKARLLDTILDFANQDNLPAILAAQ